MSYLVFDTETSGALTNKGNPFDPRNKLVVLAYDGEGYPVEYGDDPYLPQLAKFQGRVDESKVLVGFNLKFDLHWIKRYDIDIRGKRVWDCQLYHFIKMNQTTPYPSLNDVLSHYNLPLKLDKVKTEYWDMGIDTDQIPWEVLEDYAAYDVAVTEDIYEFQIREFQDLPRNRQNMILLQMDDLLVLEEMEYNGFLYNKAKSLAMGEELERQIVEIDNGLQKYCPNVGISFNSDRQLSAFLYGGDVVKDEQEDYVFHYKSGETKVKQRWVKKTYQLPRIVAPLKGTENNNGWSTDTDTLKTLAMKSKGFVKGILETLILRSKLEKRKSTYCYGTPKLLDKMQWDGNLLHPSLNQCVAITGRLSCNKPNLQNQDGDMRECFPSRFSMRGGM